MQKEKNMIRFDILEKYESLSLSHFSTTISGGVSEGNYATFNLGLYSGDTLQNLIENRKQLAASLGISTENIFLPYQTHEDKICVIDDTFLGLSIEEQQKRLHGIDAIITRQKNICIGVTTADCVPILVYDPVLHVLASIHAGWRGTVARIASKTLAKMQEMYNSKPSNLIVAIAPSISQKNFEVGEEVVERFIQAGFSLEKIACKNPQSGKMHLNLQLANKILLMESGIPEQNIEISELCTYHRNDLFFSARRQSIKSGRMLTGGVLR